MPDDFDLSTSRAVWLSRNILPHEAALRAQISRWRLPADLEADDVIQEAYARLSTVEIDGIRNPKAYFFQVARSLVLMHVRRSRIVSIQTVEQIERLPVASEEPGPDVQVSDRQQLHLLAEMIAKLPEASHKAMVLRLVHELSHREIGERLGMSANAVQKSLAKSLSKFIEQLGRGGLSPSDASIGKIAREYQPENVETRDQLRD